MDQRGIIGNYVIDREIGRGGMGVVYRATHRVLGHSAAIKVLLATTLEHRDRVERFLNEARAAKAIGHPGIVTVYDVGFVADDRAYIAMELLDGNSLSALLRGGALPVRIAIDYARQIADALAAAHEAGIVHRDLKPDNIFVQHDRRVKLVDFGIAKLAGPVQPGNVRTATGALIGTPAYMSPEQCEGQRDIDARSDLYSLGCVIFSMLAGRPVFESAGTGSLIGMHLTVPPPPLRTYCPSASPALEAVVQTLLAKSRDERFQTARALSRALSVPEVSELVGPPGLEPTADPFDPRGPTQPTGRPSYQRTAPQQEPATTPRSRASGNEPTPFAGGDTSPSAPPSYAGSGSHAPPPYAGSGSHAPPPGYAGSGSHAPPPGYAGSGSHAPPPAIGSGTHGVPPSLERVPPTLPMNHAPIPQLQPDPARSHALTQAPAPAPPARRGRTIALVGISAIGSAVIAVLVMRGCRSEPAKPEAPVAVASGSDTQAPVTVDAAVAVAIGSGSVDRPGAGDIIASALGDAGVPIDAPPPKVATRAGSGSAAKRPPPTPPTPKPDATGSGSALDKVAIVDKPVDKPVEKPVIEEPPPEPIQDPPPEPPPSIDVIIECDPNNPSIPSSAYARLDQIRMQLFGKPHRIGVVGHYTLREGGANPRAMGSGRANAVLNYLVHNTGKRLRPDQVLTDTKEGRNSGVRITIIRK